jgi:hypothetical protein
MMINVVADTLVFRHIKSKRLIYGGNIALKTIVHLSITVVLLTAPLTRTRQPPVTCMV